MLAPTRPLLRLTVARSGSRWRVMLAGELDLHSGRTLTEMVGVLAAARVDGVDLDLAGVTFIDSAGWEAVDAARAEIIGTGGTFELVALSPALTRYAALADGLSHIGYRPWAATASSPSTPAHMS